MVLEVLTSPSVNHLTYTQQEKELLNKKFNTNMLNMYLTFLDDKDAIPYKTKFLYDIIYFAYIHYRPDVFSINPHITSLNWVKKWNSEVPYVANTTKWYLNEHHYDDIMSGNDAVDYMAEFYNDVIKSLVNTLTTLEFGDEDLSKNYSFSLENNNITIEKIKEILQLPSDNFKKFQQIIDSDTTNIINKKYRNLLLCLLSDTYKKTTFVREDSAQHKITNMKLPNVDKDNVAAGQIVTCFNNNTNIFGDEGFSEFDYPPIQLQVVAKTDRVQKKKNLYNKETMDGAHSNVLSNDTSYKNLSSDINLFCIALYHVADEELIKEESKEESKEEKDYTIIPINEHNYVKTEFFDEIKIKWEKSKEDVIITVKYKPKLRKNYDTCQYKLNVKEYDDIINTFKEFIRSVTSDMFTNVSLDISAVETLYSTLEKERRKTFKLDPFSIIIKTLNVYQSVIDVIGYDEFIKKNKDGTDYSPYTETMTQNVLLAFGTVFRNKKNIIEELNNQLQDNTINKKTRRVTIEESKVDEKGYDIKVLWTGLWDEVDVSIPFNTKFTRDKFKEKIKIQDVFSRNRKIDPWAKDNVKEYETKFIEKEEWTEENKKILIKYIWHVSQLIKLERDLQETNLSKIKKFFLGTKMMMLYALLIAVFVITSNLDATQKKTYHQQVTEYLGIPYTYTSPDSDISRTNDAVNKMSNSSKLIIKNAVNPFIKCSTSPATPSNNCLLSVSDTFDSLFYAGKTPVIFNTVLYSSMDQMDSTTYDSFIDAYYADVEFEYGMGKVDTVNVEISGEGITFPLKFLNKVYNNIDEMMNARSPSPQLNAYEYLMELATNDIFQGRRLQSVAYGNIKKKGGALPNKMKEDYKIYKQNKEIKIKEEENRRKEIENKRREKERWEKENTTIGLDGRQNVRRLKGSQRKRKESTKVGQYKKSIRQQAKQECKRSQRKLKAMLRRSARIQAQAKKLRKSLKKRRCDGTSDLFSSCYVNKTAY